MCVDSVQMSVDIVRALQTVLIHYKVFPPQIIISISISIVMMIIKMTVMMVMIGGMVIICRRICGGAEVASTGITNSSDHSHRELLSSSSRSSSTSEV